eukprot:gene10834-11809_t
MSEEDFTNPTTVVDLHAHFLRERGYTNFTAWRSDPRNFYIGRSGFDTVGGETVRREGSVWGNPFKAGRDGDLRSRLFQYKRYIRGKIERKEVDLSELHGKRLGCWCVGNAEICFDANLPVDQYVCHGQVLLKILQER